MLQWDGKAYNDITTVVDLPRQVIRGRTKGLGAICIMSENSAVRKLVKPPGK
ncbi:MAG: hypothetical protein ACYTAN_16595 [Planctomycetota bacterium]|jgi:hypothetical protein